MSISRKEFRRPYVLHKGAFPEMMRTTSAKSIWNLVLNDQVDLAEFYKAKMPAARTVAEGRRRDYLQQSEFKKPYGTETYEDMEYKWDGPVPGPFPLTGFWDWPWVTPEGAGPIDPEILLPAISLCDAELPDDDFNCYCSGEVTPVVISATFPITGIVFIFGEGETVVDYIGLGTNLIVAFIETPDGRSGKLTVRVDMIITEEGGNFGKDCDSTIIIYECDECGKIDCGFVLSDVYPHPDPLGGGVVSEKDMQEIGPFLGVGEDALVLVSSRYSYEAFPSGDGGSSEGWVKQIVVSEDSVKDIVFGDAANDPRRYNAGIRATSGQTGDNVTGQHRQTCDGNFLAVQTASLCVGVFAENLGSTYNYFHHFKTNTVNSGFGTADYPVAYERICRLPLTSDDASGHNARFSPALNNNWQTVVSVDFTPSETDDYLLVACALGGNISTINARYGPRFRVTGHTGPGASSQYIFGRVSEILMPWAHFTKESLTASTPYTFKIESRTDAAQGSTRIYSATLAVVKSKRGSFVFTHSDGITAGGGGITTYLTESSAYATGKYLLLLQLRIEPTVAMCNAVEVLTYTFSDGAETLLSGTTSFKDFRTRGLSTDPYMLMSCIALSEKTSPGNWDIKLQASTPSAAFNVKEGKIAIFKTV
jgi:hypothetical protein